MPKPFLLHRPKRGEIWIVELDPTRGHEMQKTRYCLVIQSDVLNKRLHTFIIAPLTSKVKEDWCPIGIILKKGDGGVTKESQIMLNQLKAADITRFKSKIGNVSQSIMDQVNDSISSVLGLQ